MYSKSPLYETPRIYTDVLTVKYTIINITPIPKQEDRGCSKKNRKKGITRSGL